EDLFIILLNNFGNYGQNVWATGMGVASIVFGLPYDNWKARTEMNIDKKFLLQYTGEYESNMRKKFQLKLKDDGLYFFSKDLPGGLTMIAESENSFYFRDFNTQFLFNKNADGTTSGVTIHEHGRDYIYTKKK